MPRTFREPWAGGPQEDDATKGTIEIAGVERLPRAKKRLVLLVVARSAT